MANTPYKPDWQRAIEMLSAVVIVFIATFLLYWARSIFIPLALAIFFAFVLAPVVNLLHIRLRLGRVPSVMLVVVIALGMTGITGWLVTRQLSSLTATLPDHSEAIRKKIESVRDWISANQNDRLSKMMKEMERVINPEANPESPSSESESSVETKAVVVETRRSSWANQFSTYLSPAVEILGQMAFSFVLVIFILLKREDLRNRMIRLVGDGRVTTVTKALDDASHRVSRYLLMQLLLNAGFGTLIMIGLFIIGVKYAILWGFLAAALRYIPYIGTIIGVIPPIIFSLAMSDGFTQPLSIIALYFTLEAINNNILEPKLYGKRLGISEVALLVAAAFWSFLWGPVGLILSSPLTTCLLVLGKYVPQAKFLDVILGDEPALEPKVAFYQRLTARDQDEASDIMLKEAKTKPVEQVFDEVLLPALSYARRAADQGEHSEADLKVMLRVASEIVDEVMLTVKPAKETAAEIEAWKPEDHRPRVPILICPARDEVDVLGCDLIGRMMHAGRWDMEIGTHATLASELMSGIAEKKQGIVCIVAIPPGGLSHCRYLCKRLRSQFPDLKILVGFWGQVDIPELSKQLQEAGADHADETMSAMLAHLEDWRSPLAAAVEPVAA